MILKEHVPLAPLTTFRIGGPADRLVEVRSQEEVLDALSYAHEHGLSVAVLGGGSNILVPDEGVRGMVLRMMMSEVSFQKDGDDVVMCSAEAGASWDEVVLRAVTENLWGIENLSGIPGTVGGAVVQNIGAYGAVLSGIIHSVDVYDTEKRTLHTLSRDDCGFGYRTSMFKRSPGCYIVLGARVALSPSRLPNVAYTDLALRFEGGMPTTLRAVREAVLAIRRTKFPDLAEFGTAGSFFLNPVMDDGAARAVAERFPGMPLFPLPEGGVKVPVAWLLDYRHGILDMRSMTVGGAFVWPHQPLVIATRQGATAHDVRELAKNIAERVQEATGIQLEPELGKF